MESKCKILSYGIKAWFNSNNELHNEDGPAIIYPNGDKAWYLNGHRHREDGPAIEYANGLKIWYLNGKEQSPFRENIVLSQSFIREIILEPIVRKRLIELDD